MIRFSPQAAGTTPARLAPLPAMIMLALAGGAAQASLLPAGYPSPEQPMTFSIDVQGPTIGEDDSFYDIPIRGTDILTPENPSVAPGPHPPGYPPALSAPPGMFIANPPAGSVPGLNIDNAPGLDSANGWGELDALSYGRDPMDTPFPDQQKHRPHYVFSVDEFAIGQPGTAVRTEGALGNQQASADTFMSQPKPLLPMGPPTVGTNYAFTDGDGEPPSGAPGVGLIEPNAPTVRQQLPDLGDNLDAVDFDTTLADRSSWVYLSLDSAFADPLEAAAAPPNYGTAAANGFVGGDVLRGIPAGDPGGALQLYAAATALGLDPDGADTDDLDALKLWENGVDGYQKSEVPFDWMNGLTDMLLFSVRRGSAIIGTNDSIFGVPIEEGDVLTTPCSGSLPDGTACFGGGAPGIFTAAEWLGLATVRSGTATENVYGVTNPKYGRDVWADDLDALDQKVPLPGTLALLGLGLGGFAAIRRRRRSA